LGSNSNSLWTAITTYKGILSYNKLLSSYTTFLNACLNKFRASDEAVRRHYSVREYLEHGTPNVCSGPEPEDDWKFADPKNTWFLHEIDPLQHTIERYSKDQNTEKLTISTCWDRRQPRLLVISVDVAEGKTVAFDSYHKKNDLENPAYEDGDGININHIMASGTLPIFYKFKEIGGRRFYDGGILSNTPFRELLQAHRDYWVRAAGEDRHKIPDLEVYIVNVHPSKEDIVPIDFDGVSDRVNDIIYSDRNSDYDEMVTYLIADYNELADISKDFTESIDKLKDLVKGHFTNKGENDSIQNDFEQILKTTEAKRKILTSNREKYKNLVKGQFKLTNVVRIERTNYIDSNTGKEADFSSKSGDFTYETVKNLIEQGEQDAKKVLK
jgi:NTE family protein